MTKRSDSRREKRHEKKIKALAHKGNECQVCGYRRCVSSLCFHHLDPSKKSFKLGGSGLDHSWKKLKKELDKCMLLCHNCHSEIHAGLINANYYS